MSKIEHLKPKSQDELKNEILEILSSMALNERQRETILRVPGKYRLQYVKSLSLTTKRALAVKMKCYECVGFESVRDRVGNCTCRLCPLWLHRPFQKDDESEDEIEEC